MGIIDNSITNNYKKALLEGDLLQAGKAVKLAKTFKWFIETESFVDYDQGVKPETVFTGNIFSPFSYKYFPDSGIAVFFKSTINLTPTENKLFRLLSGNETFEDNIHIVTNTDIKNALWPNQTVTDNAIRILVKRLRKKIEPDPSNPQIVLNYNKKGYVFVAKREL